MAINDLNKTNTRLSSSEFRPLILDDEEDIQTQDIDTKIKDQEFKPQYIDVDKPKFVQPEQRSYYVAGNVANNEIHTTAQRPNEIEYEADVVDDEKKKDNYFGLSKLKTNKVDIVKNALKYVASRVNPIKAVADDIGKLTGKSGEDVAMEGVRGLAGSTVDFASTLKRFFYQNYMYYKGYKDEQLDKIANLGNVVAGGDSFSEDIKQKYTDFYNRIDRQTQEFKDKTERFLQYTGIGKTDKDGFIYDLVGGGASLMYAIGITALTKSPTAAAEFFGMYQYQSLYEEGIEKGFSPLKARTIGVVGGAAEGVLETIGLHVLIETLVARKGFMKLLKAAATEFVQEASQQGAEELLAKFTGMREEGLLNILQNVGYAGLIGALIGGGSATISNTRFVQKMISDSATKELINIGVKDEYAKQMVNNMLNFSVSPQVADEINSMLKDEQSPVTYKNADPRETYKEFGDTVKKALDPAQKRGVELELIQANNKLTQELANVLLNSGKAQNGDDAYRRAEQVTAMYDILAREAYNQEGIRPEDYYKRFHVNANSGQIETDERNIDDDNISMDDSFDPINFDEAERAKYEAEIEGYENWLADEQKRSGIKNNFETQKNILADMGIGKIRKLDKSNDRYGEYEALSPRIKNSFFTDVSTAMTWDEAEHILQQHNGDNADIFDYFDTIDKSVPVGQDTYLQKEIFGKVLAKEKEDIKQKAVADGTFLKAPNGKDSNLPEQLWLTVRTKAFKNWFGDWLNDPANASKVVDENGEPLVVYHGTANDFRVFDKNKSYQGLFWFSNDYNKVNAGYDGAAGKGIVMPVFLNIKNAADWDLYDKYSPEELENMKYDGLLLKDGNETVAVAFDNKQIKSINNRGSFDRRNPDIYYQRSVVVPTNKADRNNYVFKITAKDLVEARTAREIQDKLQRIFGTYEDLDNFAEGENNNIDELMFVLSNVYMADLEHAAMNRDYNETQQILDNIKKDIIEIDKRKNYNNGNEEQKEGSLSDTTRSSVLRTEKSAERNLYSDSAKTDLQVNNLSIEQLKEINNNIILFLLSNKYEGSQDYIVNLDPKTVKFFKENKIKNINENGIFVKGKSKDSKDLSVLDTDKNFYSADDIQEVINVYSDLDNTQEIDYYKKLLNKFLQLQNKFNDVQEKLRVYIVKNSPKQTPQQQSQQPQMQLQTDMQQPMLEIFNQAAYHGTPHRFDTFSTDKIGTGEGAQAHGWGLYFAANKDVSEDYRQRLTRNNGTIYVDGKPIENKKFGEDIYARRDWLKGKTLKEKLLNFRKQLVERTEHEKKNIEYLQKQIPLFEELVKKLRETKTINKAKIEAILEKAPSEIKTDVIERWEYLLDTLEDPYELMNLEDEADTEFNNENVANYFDGDVFDREHSIETSKKDIKDFQEKIKAIDSIDLDKAELKSDGQLFKVDIPDSDVLLDENKRFNDQPKKVREAIKKIAKELPFSDFNFITKEEYAKEISDKFGNKAGEIAKEIIDAEVADREYKTKETANKLVKAWDKWAEFEKENNIDINEFDINDIYKVVRAEELKGRSIYYLIASRINGSDNSYRDASLLLNKYGVKGIKYHGGLDGRAYVIFDDKAVKILEKYYQKAYHGTPYKFNRFSTDNVGTGEGAAVHGWGLYFAKNLNVADSYKFKLTPKTAELYVDPNDFTLDEQYHYYRKDNKFYVNGYDTNDNEKEITKKEYVDALTKAQEINLKKQQEDEKQGQLFAVDIPENNVLLDEDKYFDEQPKKVQKAIRKIYDNLTAEQIENLGYDSTNEKQREAAKSFFKDIVFGNNVTGQGIYETIMSLTGGDPKQASLLLNKYGVKGIRYEGKLDGEGFVVFDDKAIKILEEYYQQQQQEQPRGSIISFDRQYWIDLFSTSDKSTLLHEGSHGFLSEVLYFAKGKNPSAKILAIKKQLDNWLGVPEDNGRYSTRQQELFAKTSEVYFMEGKAPTPKLKTVFERFKKWLTDIYDAIRNDLPKINDDVRELFDTILSRSYDVPDSNIYAGKESAIKEVIKNINEGRASEVDGITIDDVYNLLNIAYTRKPSKPSKNLKQLLNDKNIYDFNELTKAGADTVLQILKDGGYVKEDATAEQALELARQALDGKPIYRLADQWRVAGDIDFARNLRVLEKVIEFSQIDSVMEKILTLQEEGYRNVEQGDIEQVKDEYKRLMSADVKEAKKIVEDIINRLHKKRFIDRAAQKQMINDLKFSATVEEIKESVLNVIEDLQDEIKLIKEQLRNPRKPIIKKDKTIPPSKNATEEEKNEYKKYMRRQIDRLLKQALPRKQNQQKFSKFDIETQRFFTDLEKYNKMTIEQAQEELYKRATSIIDDDGVGLDNFSKMKNMFLSYKANKINQNTTEFYKQLYDNLQEINVFGRNAKDIENTLKKEQIQKDINDLVVNIEENKSKNSLATGVKKQYVKWLGNWWSTINAVAGKKQADKDSLERVEIDIFNTNYKTTEDLKTKCAAALGLKNATDLDMTVNRYLNEEYVYEEHDARSNTSNAVKLNKMQFICCYIWLKNSTLRDRIIRAYGNEQIIDMMNKLTIQDKKFGDELQQSVASLYDDVNKVYLKMYGLDMPQAENYFPSSTERIQGNMDLLKDNIGQVSSPGFIKARIESNLPLMNFGNPVKMALDHIAKVNHFIYMQEKLADLNKVYKTTIVKRHITNAYGDRVYKYILQVLDNAKFSNVARAIDGISDVGDYLVNNYVLTKIAVKPSIMVKQLLSCINYAEDMSSTQWFSGFLKGVAHPKKTIDFMMTNSKYCQSRFAKGGQTEALLKAMEGRNATFAKVKTFKGMLSWMTRVGDIGAIIFGGYPLVVDQMSKGVSLEKAIEKFEQATVRSQQASLPSTLSNFQYRGMNSWLYRAMFAFANTPNQYSRKMADAMYMYFHGDIDKKQLAKTLTIYGVLNPLLYTSFTSLAILSGLVSGNWDDLKDDIIMSLMQTSNVLALPIVSQAYNSFVSRVVTGKFTPDKEIPLLDDMIKIMRTATKEELEFNDYLTIVDEVASLLFGVPIKTAYNEFIGSTKDLLDGEYGKFAVKLYGATQSRAEKIFD